jgi:primosomal protein N' (replication factor Y)
MARRAGRHRVHLLFQANRREALHALLQRLPGEVAAMPAAKRVRWSLDVDPLDLY